MEIRDKKITVVGLARSGAGAANLLSLLGAEVTVTDNKTADVLSRASKALRSDVKTALGGHPDNLFEKADLIIVSPGVPLETEMFNIARRNGVPVIGELELASQVLEGSITGKVMHDLNRNPRMMAITGSNGKSTTTTLCDLMIRKARFGSLMAGNIGNALSEEIYEIMARKNGDKTTRTLPEWVVLEVSSFQLEAIEHFRPKIASILNITPDHMDRYHSLSDYANAKARIFENQKAGDYLVLNADDAVTTELYQELAEGRRPGRPEVFFFSRMKQVAGIFAKDGDVWCSLPSLGSMENPLKIIETSSIGIQGVHNLENAMAASAMALLAECPIASVREALLEFSGLEHRLEFVRELRGVRYINDSKGTNVGAVVKSLEGFSVPVILIAGGRDKAGDFSALRQLVSDKVKTLVLIGEAAGKIKAAIGDITDTVMAHDLRHAVQTASQRADTGDVVLLSPACASFDMFADFEDRGRQFKRLVMEMEA